MQNANYATHSN